MIVQPPHVLFLMFLSDSLVVPGRLFLPLIYPRAFIFLWEDLFASREGVLLEGRLSLGSGR